MTVQTHDVASKVPATTRRFESKAPVHRNGLYRLGAKRVIDVLLVLVALPFVAPFIALIAAIISLDGHSPFFRQERVGRDGRRFHIWKFRTMVPNAEALLEQYLTDNPAARTEWDAKQKLSDDPRCTRIGRALRRTSMDELPQILNVLAGEMSLVGPRPMMTDQQSIYPGRSYYNLRPGMTGNWQVSRRNDTTFADRAVYDDMYYSELSFWTDLRILARTVSVVVRGTGC